MSQRAPGRRTLRERKVSQRVAVVDESTRQQAAQARLDALEADNDVGEDTGMAGSDDEFVLAQDEDEEDEEVEISDKKRRKKKQGAGAAAKRRLRTSGTTQRMPRTFARLLEEAALDRLPPTMPTYLTAQAGPPVAANAVRKFCSVCGNNATYKCPRCSSRYCCRKCYSTHVETRCLKFLS